MRKPKIIIKNLLKILGKYTARSKTCSCADCVIINEARTYIKKPDFKTKVNRRLL